MNGRSIFRFYRATRITLGLLSAVGIVIFGIAVCCWRIHDQFATEHYYQIRFAADWQTQFEHDYGSLTKARTKVGIATFGVITITAVLVWLCRVLNPQHPGDYQEGPPRSYRRESLTDRIARFRRNTIVYSAVGFAFVISAAALALFPSPLFVDRDDAITVAILVFVIGYALVIVGGWNWAKAKAWNEMIVIVGLLPVVALLLITCIPWLRIIVLADLMLFPAVLPVSMILMSVVMVVAVALLPDRSGLPK